MNIGKHKMPKRKSVAKEEVDTTSTKPTFKPDVKLPSTKKAKVNGKDTKSIPKHKERCSEIVKVFQLYIDLYNVKNSTVTEEVELYFFDPRKESGVLCVVIDLFKKHNVKSSLTISNYQEDKLQSTVGFINDVISYKILQPLKTILVSLIQNSNNEVINSSFIYLVEKNMEIISETYKGTTKFDKNMTIQFLQLLVIMYEQAWSQTFIKESNYNCPRDYIIAVSNRIHALYWHIKPEIRMVLLS